MRTGRGDVVLAIDPFKEDGEGRPFLLINRASMPFHGEQFIALTLTTRTWHDERIPLSDTMWIDGGSPESSSIMPWSVNSIKTEWISYRQGKLRDDIVDRAVSQFVSYLE